jgi:hypothetical protein
MDVDPAMAEALALAALHAVIFAKEQEGDVLQIVTAVNSKDMSE